MIFPIVTYLRVWLGQVKDEKGQGSLEYIAIVVGIVIAVAIGFYIAGADVKKAASDFVEDVIGSAESGK